MEVVAIVYCFKPSISLNISIVTTYKKSFSIRISQNDTVLPKEDYQNICGLSGLRTDKSKVTSQKKSKPLGCLSHTTAKIQV